MLYEKDGATWFPATDYGDEKDRVVVRDNGARPTSRRTSPTTSTSVSVVSIT